MEIQFASKDLEKAVQAVSKVISGRLPNPALAGILIIADKDNVYFTATNFETTIRYTMAADIKEPGRILVSGKLFHELIRRMPGPDISISTRKKDNMLTVTSGRAVYDILTMNVFEYPELEFKAEGNSLSLKASMLQEIQRKVAFAVMETEVTSPVFSGVYLSIKEGTMAAIASDKKRLARLTFSLDGTGEVILPPKAFSEFTTLVDPENDVSVSWSKGKVIFQTANLCYESRVISGTFPNIEQVIPKSPVATISVDRLELVQAIERLSLIGLERRKEFTLNNIHIAMNSDMIYIRSSNADKGAACEEIPAAVDGESIEICFHGTQVVDCLKVLVSDKVTISITAPRSPASIVGDKDDNYIYVLSPIAQHMAQAAG